MSLPHDIIRLYSTVLFHDIRRHFISDDDMKSAISEMQRVYMPEKNCLISTARRLADYNSPAHRCAYLHKYAPFHTAMVCDVMLRILKENESVYWSFRERLSLIQTRQQKFQLCSLGGGPGSDIVGILATLFDIYGLFRCSAKVIDIKSDWRDTVTSVVQRLRFGTCGSFLEEGFKQFNFEYVTADLLEDVKDGVKIAVENADLVSMVKFVSAAACESTELMLKKIFRMVKPGAFVLFIDNAAGGFREIVCKAATDCYLTSVCGPISYQQYTNDFFNITHWDHASCYSTTVTIHLMKRLHPCPPQIKTPPKAVPTSKPISNKCGNGGHPVPSKLTTPTSNGDPIPNKLPVPSSNGEGIPNKLPVPISNGEGIPSKLPVPSSNGEGIPSKLPVPSSNGEGIPSKLPVPSSNGEGIPIKFSTSNSNGKPILHKLLPSGSNGKLKTSKLPSPSTNGKPIIQKISSPCSNGKLEISKLPTPSSNCDPIIQKVSSSSNGEPIQNEVSISNSHNDATHNEPNKMITGLVCKSSMKQMSVGFPSTYKSIMAEVPKYKGYQNIISSNGYFCHKLLIKSGNLVRKSKCTPKSIVHRIPNQKKRKFKSIQDNFDDPPKHKIYLKDIKNNGTCKPVVTTNKPCEVSSSHNSMVLKENSSLVQTSRDIKRNGSASSSYTLCKVAFGVGSKDENVQLNESVDYLVISDSEDKENAPSYYISS